MVRSSLRVGHALVAALTAGISSAALAQGVGSAITYQGELRSGGGAGVGGV